jgi:organic hydroperoxide reductase OsmC/OhrA
MSEHGVRVEWNRGTADFLDEYSRSHQWTFDGGSVIEASSAPAYRGDPTCVDPEEAFLASISSCHMLWFLSLAADAGFVVDRYVDDVVGTMTTDAGVTWLSTVDLRPTLTWSGATLPTDADIAALHADAHHRCFIANSVKTHITIHGR